MKRVFLVAGEASGDTHGAHLVRALKSRLPSLECEGLGGTAMAQAGMRLRHDLAGEAIMGFAEVVRHFPRIRRLFLDTAAFLKVWKPDALVLVDYPGFNIRLAKAASKLGIRVVYYISPQVWAWKRNRIHTLAECVDQMLVIFPFEEPLYLEAGAHCTYVGHPLLDHIEGYQPRRQFAGDPVIGLLPGSRAQEIGRMLEPMIAAARGIRQVYPKAQFAVPCVDEQRAAQIRTLARDFPLEIAVDGMYDVLSAARFCMVSSGTATLETALFGCPMVIMYKMSPPTYWLARLVVRHVEHIGMVNILAGRRIVPEFIQHQAVPEAMLPEALELIADSAARREMLDGLARVRESLGGPGASRRAAECIWAGPGEDEGLGLPVAETARERSETS